MNRYTVVVDNLRMCMKEDYLGSKITREKNQGRLILL